MLRELILADSVCRVRADVSEEYKINNIFIYQDTVSDIFVPYLPRPNHKVALK